MDRHVIEDAVEIACPPESVFDYCTDMTREPEWDRRLRAVEKLSSAPLGAGTLFRARFGPHVEWTTVSVLRFDRPRSWAVAGVAERLDVRFEGEVHPTPAGSRLCIRTVLIPHGPRRVALPLLSRVARVRWRRNLLAIKAALEA